MEVKICKNGHCFVTDIDSINNCKDCGSGLIYKCDKCGTEIKRKDVQDIPAVPMKYKAPYYCSNCGAAYPWTQSIIDSAVTIAGFEGLDEETKNIIKNAIPFLLVDGTHTTIEAVRLRNIVRNGSEVLKNGLSQLLLSCVTNEIHQLIFSNLS